MAVMEREWAADWAIGVVFGDDSRNNRRLREQRSSMVSVAACTNE